MKQLLWANVFIAFLIVAMIAIVSMLIKQKHSHMQRLALHDNLTGIYNRHGLKTIMAQRIKELERKNMHLSVIFFDIDFFKNVNDTYGHDVGDYILQEVTKIIGENIREIDIFGRFGGEEFVIYLLHTQLNSAVSIAEKLRHKIELYPFDTINNLTCSFGVAQLQENEDNEALLKRVDILLYQAKKMGRNCVICEATKA